MTESDAAIIRAQLAAAERKIWELRIELDELKLAVLDEMRGRDILRQQKQRLTQRVHIYEGRRVG